MNQKVETKDGGPAFPNHGDNTPDYPIFDGMSLRDWFAGQALSGICANSEAWQGLSHDSMISLAWLHADAMLKAREEQNEPKE